MTDARTALDFRAIFQSASHASIVVATDAPRFTIVEANEAYTRATLTKREEILGRGLFEVFPQNPADLEATAVRELRTSLDRVIRERTTDVRPVQQYDIRRPDAQGGGFEERWWSVQNSPVFDPKGAIAYIVHRAEDVSELVRIQRARGDERPPAHALDRVEAEILARAKELQDANEKLRHANEEIARLYEKTKELDEIRTQFFSSVSHEFRTPLTLILGPAEQLAAAADTDEDTRRKLEVIVQNARTLHRHVDDLLDLAKVEAAQMHARHAEVDVARLARVVVSSFTSFAAEKQIECRIDAPGESWAEVDPDKIQRVLVNLLSNGLKFTPAGGRVRTSLRVQDDARVAIEVADSGPGIPADQREVIFEQFRQLERGTTRRFGGTGLGLTIARDLVALHGGSITVGDAPEGGALFTITLPMQAPRGAKVLPRTEPELALAEALRVKHELRGQPRRDDVPAGVDGAPLVLVVEDNPDMNRFLCESLSAKVRVVAAFDGEEGFRKAIELQPDLVLCDVMMPGKGGDELLPELRARPELASMPIVVLTAKADEALRVRLLREGAQDYITKPFVEEELQTRVSNLLEIKLAHDSLRASEARFRELFENASDGVFVADLAGRYTDVNRAGCVMLGYTRDEIIGKSIADLIDAEQADYLVEVKRALLEGATHVGVWRLRRKDGSWQPIEASAKIFPDGRWQCFARDITKRQEMERALRLSEAKFSGIVSISADAVVSIDDTQRITSWNEGAETIFGYSKIEAIGAPLDVLLPERLRAVHRGHVTRFAGEPATARKMGVRAPEITGVRKNGEEFPADAAISKLEVGGERILTVALRDITAQKRAEDEQRFLSEASAMLSSSLDYEDTLTRLARLVVQEFADVCFVDAFDDRGVMHRKRAASRDPALDWACQVIMRYELDRSESSVSWADVQRKRTVFLENIAPEAVEAYARSEEHRKALRAIDIRQTIAVPLVALDRVVGLMTLVASGRRRRFTTHDVALAEALARRAALSVANARLYRTAQRAISARDAVLGIVAHDLRNPLNSISLQAQLLAQPARDDRTVRSVEGIQRSVGRMNRMIQDLLDVASMEAGHLEVHADSVSARRIIADCVDMEQPLATAESVALGTDVTSDLPDVWGDRERLVQVLDNLVGNALKFTPAEGRITIGAEPKGGVVLFSVRDTGPGIASEDVPWVFERFWQARKGERKGAGMGLAIVRGLVEAHGGHVWVESKLGHGAAFFFTIPIRRPSAKQRRSA